MELSSILFQDTDLDYMGQLDSERLKERNGMGIYNDGGNVYFGDFLRNKKNGTGMLIAKNKGKIKNLPNCMVYVGAWMGNKKQGRGSCYDFSGNLIYQGKFEDDKPIGQYPASNIDMEHKFSIISVEGGIYVGELKTNTPNGFGMYLANDGELSFGKVRDGVRYGTSLLLLNPYDWKVVKWEGDSYSEIINSEFYIARSVSIKNSNKEAKKTFYKKWRGELFEVALGLASSTTQLVAVANSGGRAVTSAVSSSSGASPDGRNSTSNRQKSSVSSKTSNCGTAWQNDSKNYSELETRVMECTDETQYKSLQAKMRAIRTKWLSRDCHITQSEWETKPFEEHKPADVTNFY